jgi:hypothetical protein
MSRFVCLFVSASLGITACATNDKVGQIDLSLTGTSASGITYRLRNAELTISGGSAPIVLHTEDDPTRTVIDQELDVGSYTLQVTDGWRLERLGSGGITETVVATLVSPNPQPFTIASDTLTSVVLSFSTRGEVVTLAPGHVGISIGVDDTLASCAELHAASPAAGDGVYTITRGTGSIQVFCDMTHGGITYEQLAFGNSFTSYAGYAPISTADLNDSTGGRAFAALFNLQGFGLVNLDTSFNSSNCCIKLADSGPGVFLTLGGHFVYPAGLDGTEQCNTGYTAPKFSFRFGDTGQNAPAPLPSDFFVANPAGATTVCGDANNPGWFFKRF